MYKLFVEAGLVSFSAFASTKQFASFFLLCNFGSFCVFCHCTIRIYTCFLFNVSFKYICGLAELIYIELDV